MITMQNLRTKDANYREGTWKLLRYGYKTSNSQWSIIEPEKDEIMSLVLKHMSLKIIKGKALVAESFSFLMHDIKRIVHYKDSMALVTEQQNARRSVRFQFAGGMTYTGEDFCNQCVQTLSRFVAAENVNKNNHFENPVDMSFTQYVSQFIKNSKGLSAEKIKKLEFLYPLEEIVDECLLDVDFPDLYVETRGILQAKLDPKSK